MWCSRIESASRLLYWLRIAGFFTTTSISGELLTGSYRHDITYYPAILKINDNATTVLSDLQQKNQQTRIYEFDVLKFDGDPRKNITALTKSDTSRY